MLKLILASCVLFALATLPALAQGSLLGIDSSTSSALLPPSGVPTASAPTSSGWITYGYSQASGGFRLVMRADQPEVGMVVGVHMHVEVPPERKADVLGVTYVRGRTAQEHRSLGVSPGESRKEPHDFLHGPGAGEGWAALFSGPPGGDIEAWIRLKRATDSSQPSVSCFADAEETVVIAATLPGARIQSVVWGIDLHVRYMLPTCPDDNCRADAYRTLSMERFAFAARLTRGGGRFRAIDVKLRLADGTWTRIQHLTSGELTIAGEQVGDGGTARIIVRHDGREISSGTFDPRDPAQSPLRMDIEWEGERERLWGERVKDFPVVIGRPTGIP